jgi:hypothetical protein
VFEVIVLRDNDVPGATHQETVARSCVAAGLPVKWLALPGLPPLHDKHGEDVTDWLEAGHSSTELEELAAAAPFFVAATVAKAEVSPTSAPTEDGVAEPSLSRQGFDLVLSWADGVSFFLTAIHESRDDVRGELTVSLHARRLSWGALPLSSTQARETLRKKLENVASGLNWATRLEEAAYRLTQAARQSEPIEILTGAMPPPTRELVPGLLYEGEPTLLYGDGDTGKSLFAQALAIAAHAHVGLTFRLKPVRAVPVAYLDWETTRETLDTRLALLSAGLGIDPPPMLYKRMTRPLIAEAPSLAADFARRGLGLVVIDSKMFAVAGGGGAPFHEPITAFYSAVRLFAPAAMLVLNHITNDAAKSGSPARPFGGAFAFNGPRLIWEARRDHDVENATAIAFACKKANNLPARPEPFGLQFVPGQGTITIFPFDLAEAAPQALTGTGLTYRTRALLTATGDTMTTPEIAAALHVPSATARTVLRRLATKGQVSDLGTEGRVHRWGPPPR